MMGADGGFHALHSCIGAGAHFAVLVDPLPEAELTRIAKAIDARRSTVIVVAEGYARSLRQELNRQPEHELTRDSINTTSGRPEFQDLSNAAEFLHWQLKQTGCLLSGKKVVREPFTRDIRGAAPNNLDVFLSRIMAHKVEKLMAEGATEMMPSVEAGRVGSIHFECLQTCNTVDPEMMALADNLGMN